MGDILSCLDPVTTHTTYSLGDHHSVQMASVLLIIHYNYSRPHILLTKRSSALRSHSGEICFPGGKFAKDDKSLYHTAIRETKEEVGLDFTEKDISGSLEAVKTLTSNYIIVPYITVQHKIPRPRILLNEVQRVLDVPLTDILKTISPDKAHGYLSVKDTFKFTYKNEVIWGATARILKQLRDRLHTYKKPY
jgi:8-oxo-dGTP pyrophosphatase MutT (NUDIX family)